MIRKILKIAVFLLVANFVYQVAPVAFHQFQFKDALQELALFSQKSTDTELVDRVMVLADEHSIVLAREDVQVRREIGSIVIAAAYVQTFKFVPGWDYPWEFDVHAKAMDTSVAPPKSR
jgi:hypothetical protein